jgi:hypothetical protein
MYKIGTVVANGIRAEMWGLSSKHRHTQRRYQRLNGAFGNGAICEERRHSAHNERWHRQHVCGHGRASYNDRHGNRRRIAYRMHGSVSGDPSMTGGAEFYADNGGETGAWIGATGSSQTTTWALGGGSPNVSIMTADFDPATGGPATYTANITDTLLSMSDSIVETEQFTRPLTDTLLTPSDSIVRTVAATRSITDTLLSGSPAIAITKGPLRTLTDTLLTPSDTIAPSVVLTRPLTDTLLSPSDSITVVKGPLRTVTDTLLTPSDVIAPTVALTRPISDTLLTPSDSITAVKGPVRTITDTLLGSGYIPDANDLAATSFETESTTGQVFNGGAAGALAFSTANPRTGTRHIRASLTTSSDSKVNGGSGVRTFAARFSVYMSALGTGTCRFFTIDGPTGVSRLQMSTLGVLVTNIGGTSGTNIITLAPSTLYV